MQSTSRGKQTSWLTKIPANCAPETFGIASLNSCFALNHSSGAGTLSFFGLLRRSGVPHIQREVEEPCGESGVDGALGHGV